MAIARYTDTGDWNAKVCGFLDNTPDFQKKSSRLSQTRIALIKRRKDFEDGKRVTIEVRNL